MVLCLGKILGRGCLWAAVGIITLPCFLGPGSSSSGAHTAHRYHSCLTGPAWPLAVYLTGDLKVHKAGKYRAWLTSGTLGVGWEAWPPVNPKHLHQSFHRLWGQSNVWGDPHSCSLGTDSSKFVSMFFFFFGDGELGRVPCPL